MVKIRFSRHTEGSLVVVFLTSYEDGGFVLREYDHEWVIDLVFLRQ